MAAIGDAHDGTHRPRRGVHDVLETHHAARELRRREGGDSDPRALPRMHSSEGPLRHLRDDIDRRQIGDPKNRRPRLNRGSRKRQRFEDAGRERRRNRDGEGRLRASIESGDLRLRHAQEREPGTRRSQQCTRPRFIRRPRDCRRATNGLQVVRFRCQVHWTSEIRDGRTARDSIARNGGHPFEPSGDRRDDTTAIRAGSSATTAGSSRPPLDAPVNVRVTAAISIPAFEYAAGASVMRRGSASSGVT